MSEYNFNGNPKLLEEGFHYSGRVSSSMLNLDYIVSKLSRTKQFDMSEIRLIERNGMYDVYIGRRKTTQDFSASPRPASQGA